MSSMPLSSVDSIYLIYRPYHYLQWTAYLVYPHTLIFGRQPTLYVTHTLSPVDSTPSSMSSMPYLQLTTCQTLADLACPSHPYGISLVDSIECHLHLISSRYHTCRLYVLHNCIFSRQHNASISLTPVSLVRQHLHPQPYFWHIPFSLSLLFFFFIALRWILTDCNGTILFLN